MTADGKNLDMNFDPAAKRLKVESAMERVLF